MRQTTALSATALSLMLLAGCQGSSTDNNTGTLNVGVTDAPIDDAASVWVEFTGVTLKPKDGEQFTTSFTTPKKINLLNLQGSDFDFLLENQTFPSGDYNWMRLEVNASKGVLDSYIELTVGGTQYPLYVPSGAESGLKLNNGFTIPKGGTQSLTIDFDLRKSIVAPSNKNDTDYKLKPVLRMIEDANAGHIIGTVPTNLASDPNCAGAVYAYEGSDTTPDDEGSSGANPVSTGLVSLNSNTGNYEYGIGFLDAGHYTVAFTCEANLDQAEVDDNVTFLGQTNADVVAGQTGTYDIVAY